MRDIQLEDKILDYIEQMVNDIDCSKVDRIEIIFNDNGLDVNIESSDEVSDFDIQQMLNWDDETIERKSRIIALLMTPYKDNLIKFLNNTYDLIKEDTKWVGALNMYFDDIAKHNGKSYKLQVIDV